MHPYIHAQNMPDQPAYIMASTDEVVTYKQLNDRSNQIAQLARARVCKLATALPFLWKTMRIFWKFAGQPSARACISPPYRRASPPVGLNILSKIAAQKFFSPPII